MAYVNRFMMMPRRRAATSTQSAQIILLHIGIGAELALKIFVLAIDAVPGLTPSPQ